MKFFLDVIDNCGHFHLLDNLILYKTDVVLQFLISIFIGKKIKFNNWMTDEKGNLPLDGVLFR